MSKPISKSFQAVLERRGGGLNWRIARIPFNAAKLWGARGRLRVKGEMNGVPFRSALFADGVGGHFLLVNKRTMAGAKTGIGDVARFRLEADTEERVAVVPAEMKRLLAQSKQLGRWFDQLNYTTRNEIAQWITEVKSAEARARRAAQLAERLLATMEAERELPPALQLAFARNASARVGWERMSVAQRRQHLLAIFYYRDPEARARRIAKVVEAAAEWYENKKVGHG